MLFIKHQKIYKKKTQGYSSIKFEKILPNCTDWFFNKELNFVDIEYNHKDVFLNYAHID
jgi:hypothetical protein